MGEGIDALAESAAAAPAQDVTAAPLGDEERRRLALEQLKPAIGQMLSIVPRAVAFRFKDKRFLLEGEEKAAGVEAWACMIEAYFPELERLLKIFALIGVICWTGMAVLTRLQLAGEIKRKRIAQARARPEGDGDAGGKGPGEDPPEADRHDGALEDDAPGDD